MSLGEEKRIDLREYLRIVWRRKWLIVTPFVVACALAFLVSMPRFMPPIYESSATLVWEFPPRMSVNLEQLVNTSGSREQSRVQNLLQSNEFLSEVINQAEDLRSDPGAHRWAEDQRSRYPSMTDEELVELYLQRYLRQTIALVSDRRNPDMFVIRVSDQSPHRAHRLCTLLTSAVLDAAKSMVQKKIEDTRDFAHEQLAGYRSRLDEAEAKLHEYSSGKHLEAVQRGLVNQTNVTAVEGLARNARGEAESAWGTRNAKSRSVAAHDQNPDEWLTMIRPQGVETLTAQYLDLARELTRSEIQELSGQSDAGTSYAIQMSQKGQDLDDALEQMVLEAPGGSELSPQAFASVFDLLESDVEARRVDARAKVIADLVADYHEKAAELPQMALHAERLNQEVRELRMLYETFRQQITSAAISEAYEAKALGGQLIVIGPPTRPFAPVHPNRKMILALAGIAGIFLGLVLVFVVEHHDLTVRDVSELPEHLRNQVVGSIPLIRDRLKKEREYRRAGLKGQTIPIFDYYRDEAASSFEFRRLVLELSRDGKLPSSVMVTSSERAEGKTLTSCLLALTIARHRKVKTLLIDLDFRKPNVHKTLGVAKHTPGSAEALLERSLNRDTIRPTPEGNLFVLPAGSFRNISAESITPESVRWLLDEVRQWFDVVIIDSPPNLAVPDPLVIGQMVDSVLFVVKAGSTSQRVLIRGYELQQRSRENVVGIVLNNVRDVMPYYYNYEHYGYITEDEPQTVVSGDKA